MASALARVLPAALLAGSVATADTYNGYELPAYTVERRLGEGEIRAYAPMILAEVVVEGERRAALSRGFRVLARYIFGGNATGGSVAMTVPVTQEIAMTAPVSQSAAGDGRWSVSFMMPARWRLDTLPTPRDPAVAFRETDPERVAVLTFSGRATAARLAEREARLRSLVAAAGLTASGPVRHAYYDDPFTLPWARRNEVLLPLAD